MHDFSLIQAPQIGGPGYQFPTVVATPPPNFDAPHDFLALALVTTIICAILNLISLAFGIPAIILSVMVSLYMHACMHNWNYTELCKLLVSDQYCTVE